MCQSSRRTLTPKRCWRGSSSGGKSMPWHVAKNKGPGRKDGKGRNWVPYCGGGTQTLRKKDLPSTGKELTEPGSTAIVRRKIRLQFFWLMEKTKRQSKELKCDRRRERLRKEKGPFAPFGKKERGGGGGTHIFKDGKEGMLSCLLFT